MTLTVNGETCVLSLSAMLLLREYRRERLRLTDTHIGCEPCQDGDCTVLSKRPVAPGLHCLGRVAAIEELPSPRGSAPRSRRFPDAPGRPMRLFHPGA